MNVFSTAADPS